MIYTFEMGFNGIKGSENNNYYNPSTLPTRPALEIALNGDPQSMTA
jgi:hypothetical protein